MFSLGISKKAQTVTVAAQEADPPWLSVQGCQNGQVSISSLISKFLESVVVGAE